MLGARGQPPPGHTDGGISTSGWVDCDYPTDTDGHQNGYHWEDLEVRATLQAKTGAGDGAQIATIVGEDETHNSYLPHVASPELKFNTCLSGQYRVVVDAARDTWLRWGTDFGTSNSHRTVGPWTDVKCEPVGYPIG